MSDPGTYIISTDFIRPLLDGQGLRLFGSTSGYVGLKPADASGSVDFTLPAADGTSGQVIQTDGTGNLSFTDQPTVITDHGSLSGLSDDDHPQYFLQGGRFGGQLIYGGTAASNNLFVQSTSNATKGYVLLENFAEFRTTDVRFRGSTSGYVGLKPPAVGDNTIYRLPVNDGSANQVIQTDGNGNLSFATPSAGVTDHGALTGLTDDDHTQYALLAGRSGGQLIYGGTAASDDLILMSTSNATKGDIILNDSTILLARKSTNTLITSTTPAGDTGIVNRGYMRANNLTIGSNTGTNFTANVGELRPVTLSTATADAVVTFPVSPNTGEKFGFFVASQHSSSGTSTNFADRPYFCVEPASSTSINGSAYSRATGEGSGKYGLWVVGEILIFQYTGSTWQLIEDGRIMNIVSVVGSGTQSIANVSVVDVNFTATDNIDRFNCHSTSSNTNRIYVKRSGYYNVSANTAWANDSTGVRFIEIQTETAEVLARIRDQAFEESERTISGATSLSPGQYIMMKVLQSSGAPLNLDFGGTFMRLEESR